MTHRVLLRAANAALLLALSAVLSTGSAGELNKSNSSHRAGICGEMDKIDLLLYDEPGLHGHTATCSYTDERLLMKPRAELPSDRMKRFVFLAFLEAGNLANEDFMMPPKVYAGFGKDCQVLPIGDAARMQRLVKFGGDLEFMSCLTASSGAPHVACPR